MPPLLQPARSLDDLHKTLSPRPLITPEELEAFYRGQVNQVRGGDIVQRLELELRRAFGALHYKVFLMSHPGVGKSTALSRLIQRVDNQYRAIRFSATADLDPTNVKPFDIVLLMMIRLAEEAAKPVAGGGAATPPSEAVRREIWDWLATESVMRTRTTGVDVEAAAGAESGIGWTKVLSLFARVKGEMKFTSDRKQQVVEYRLSRLSALIDLVNRLLDEANEKLRESADREWVFIGEDFDKPGIPPIVEDLFLNYANVFELLRTHLIFTIPIALGYSQRGVRRPCPTQSIPDTPVYDPSQEPHAEGRAALRAVLEARVDPQLFADHQMERLIVASGGNLRDLFAAAREAGLQASLRGASHRQIGREDTDAAIHMLRLEYTRRLGESPYDAEPIRYDEKAKRLVAVYRNDPNVAVPDRVLYSLLRSRTVQEFNGKGRFGVPPLVVDILKSQGLLPENAAGGII